METFGFRGGEFGTWTNQEDRRQSINYAYDALIDLSRVLGVPPQSMSLNGEMGIAFGARGYGGKGAAVAHYEPTRVVINLTKMKGSGALAHEFWHAFDDYVGRLDGGRGYLSIKRASKAPAKIVEVWVGLTTAIFGGAQKTSFARDALKIDISEGRRTAYYSKREEMFARAFESYIEDRVNEYGTSDYLVHGTHARHVSMDGQVLDPYPSGVERETINACFKQLFDLLPDLSPKAFAIENPQEDTKKHKVLVAIA